ncbi:Nif3-like dinuclear metal center hexameric protein [Paenibacillus elgii]
MKVQQVIDAVLKDSCGDFRLSETGDRIMSGSPDTEVTGIVTTFMATVDVIKQAIACGANMIITHEPTYYTGKDETDWLQDDPVYAAKKKLIDENQIVIWRFHDYMHMGKTDRIYDGLLKEIGWENHMLDGNPHTYQIEEVSLAELASFFKRKLSMDVVQIIGKPEMKCSRVGILVGGGSLGLGREQMPMELMRNMNLDVMVCGEIMEWTLCAYINDAQMLGLNKAMIVVGHERSEEWGMKFMAEWLQPLVHGIPVVFIDAREPFTYL